MSNLVLKKLALSLSEFNSMNAQAGSEHPHNFDIEITRFGNQCAHCQKIFDLNPCKGCGTTKFIASRNRLGFGVFCHTRGCGTGTVEWDCKACSGKNFTAKTFGRIEEAGLIRKLINLFRK